MKPSADLRRPRLLRLLGGRWKVAVLSAPAGYGKSTVAAQYAAGRPVIWCRLHPEDRNPAHLLGSLIAAGARAKPPVGARTQRLFLSRRDMERDGGLLTSSLLHDLESRAGRLVVLDDLHSIADAKPATQWLSRVIADSSPSIRFLITCRGECPVPLARLELAGGVCALGAAELGFTGEEQLQLLRQRFRLKLGSRENAELHRALGGWAAGIVLTGQRLRDTGRAEVRTGDAGDEAAASRLFTFLAEEVFAPLPEAVKQGLLRASLLDSLEPEALASVIGKPAAAAVSRGIRAQGLFLQEGVAPGEPPRLHPLFRDYLRGRLRVEVPAAARKALLRRLHAHWVRRGETAGAIRMLASEGEIAEAVREFERAATSHMDAGPGGRDIGLLALAAELLEREPAARNSPWILDHAAAQAAQAGRYDHAVDLATRAQGVFAEHRAWDAAAAAYAVEARASSWLGGFSGAIRHGEALRRSIPRARAGARGLVEMWMGHLSLDMGEPKRSRALLTSAAQLLRRHGSPVMHAEALVRQATVAFTEGHWDTYLEIARQAHDVFRRFGHLPRAQLLLINMAEAHTYLGEETAALSMLDEVHAMQPRTASPQNPVLTQMGRGRALMELGRLAEASRAFREARAISNRLGGSLGAVELDVWEGILNRRRGKLEAAEALLAGAEQKFTELESPSWHNLARMERALVVGLRGDARVALRDLAVSARMSRKMGDERELARNRLFEARVLQVARRPFDGVLRVALASLRRLNYEVLLRKEADVAGPLTESAKKPRGAPAPLRKPRAGVRGPIHVRLLGGFEISIGDRRVKFERRAAEALVACLLLRRGGAMEREALAEALWPGVSAAKSRNRFDVTMNAARRGLEPDAGPRGPFSLLTTDAGVCRLDLSKLALDTQEFERLAAGCELLLERLSEAPWKGAPDISSVDARRERSRVAAALDACGGELLPGLRDFAWTQSLRERLRERRHRLLVARGLLDLALKNPLDADEAAGSVLEEDSLNEEALRVRLRALAARGEKVAVARAYREFERRLRKELDTAPSPETAALAEELT